MAARFETLEDGPAKAAWLVMVHGMSQDRRVFASQVAAFRTDYRIVLIDLPGHGLSSGLPGPYGHAELAAQVGAALDDIGIEACHYWATHTGTAVGLLLAVERPTRFRSLILEGVVCPGHAMASVDRTQAMVREIAHDRGVALARERWWHEGEWFAVIRELPRQCRAEAHKAIVDDFTGAPWLFEGSAQPVAPIDERLSRLNVPVLLYNGERDMEEFRAAAAAVADLLPTVRSEIVPQAGGFPAWEFPDRVNALVGGFLAHNG